MITPEAVCELLAAHGQCESQSASEWAGSVPLPDPIRDFYRDVGPVDITIEGNGNPTFFPRLSELWSHQAGYRWNGVTGAPIADWNPNWFVVADEGADPFIYSTERSEVLFAHHGEGTWTPHDAYPDILTMAACVATLGTVRVEAGDSFDDDDCEIRPECVRLAISRLTILLGDAKQAEAVTAAAGWF